MSLGIFQVLVSSWVHGVAPMVSDKMSQSSVVCQPVCLDLNCFETLWGVAVFPLRMPFMDECVWVRVNLRRCADFSVMKCAWEALSNNALQGICWPDLLWISTMAVASKMLFLGLPLNEQCVHFCSWVALGTCRLIGYRPSVFTHWVCLVICSNV